MTNRIHIELTTITTAEIEAGVRRGRELRSQYFHDLGARIAAALLRRAKAARSTAPVHGMPLAHGC